MRKNYCKGCFGCIDPCDKAVMDNKNKELLKTKMMYSFVGYGFTFLNIYSISLNRPAIGIIFGFISLGFFIKSLSIKLNK